MGTEQIKWHDKVLALIIYNELLNESMRFYTDDDNSLQAGKHWRQKGEIIRPHRHVPSDMGQITALQEVLYIKRGKVKILFYSDENKIIDQKTLNTGDMILLMAGGHSFEFLEETEMIEVKQGPYNPDSMQRFEGK